MIRNKRGEGGYIEAMISLMMVIVALTAFLSMLTYSEIDRSDHEITLDTSFVKDLELIDGKITGETEKELTLFIERNELNGTRLTINIAGTLSDASFREVVGTEEGVNVGSITGTFPIGSDDGRTFVASYEVVYWWD